MKARVASLLWLALVALSAPAATTINSANRFAYGANIGWVDWRGDGANGAVVGEFVCSGSIYAANVGWVHLGNGSPANGIRYQNNSASDFGVNHDGSGNLRGYAYGANIGWLTFTNRDAAGTIYDSPKVNLLTGKLSGFIWSANCGWISLNNAQARVQTDTLQCGPDTDGDGIPDDWELFRAGNLNTFTATSDNDGDGLTDAQEYVADTDPFDLSSAFSITSFIAAPAPEHWIVTWTSRPTRLYHVQRRPDFTSGSPWSDSSLGAIAPDTGSTTSRSFLDSTTPHSFFRIQAKKPLSE